MELKTLSKVFEKRIYRIPDYQRGYAWQHDQLRDFWEDLINLDGTRLHYTGLLTLRQIEPNRIPENSEEFWLVDEHGYEVYHVVDGQQRLTTAVILLQCIVDILRETEQSKNDDEIYLGSIKISDIGKQYLRREQEPQKIIKTYIFGYTSDNPSFVYLRHKILGEPYAGELQETFYTLNLLNAKKYFLEQIRNENTNYGIDAIKQIFKKLTQQFRFNEYVIQDDFDVYVAFETMNNRGKRLSDLELLKNRMIYLTTLYPYTEVQKDTIATLRQNINIAWKEVYYQLGRNRERPLRDDDFLRAHWIMYFRYSREKSNDYIKDLLDTQFSPKGIHEKTEISTEIEAPVEISENDSSEIIEEDNSDDEITTQVRTISKLRPKSINEYVLSLKDSAHWWYSTYFPSNSLDLTQEEKEWLDKLNRIGIMYFRPLIMALFMKVKENDTRLKVMKHIERFIFICFRLCRAMSNYKSSSYYNASRALYYGEITPDQLIDKMEKHMAWCFKKDEPNIIDSSHFHTFISKKYSQGSRMGFYSWYSPLQYLLYEYELDLMKSRGQSDLRWSLFTRREKDMVTIEHILPQTPTNDYWEKRFSIFNEEQFRYLCGSLGNLLPLSASINSSLQNDSFKDKKIVKKDSKGKIVRNGYRNGSHSEREVADDYEEWTAKSIKERGLKLLSFMESRWGFSFANEQDKTALLFLDGIELE